VLTLYATRVLDLALPAPEEDDEPGQETDRHYLDHPWRRRRRPGAAPIQHVDRAPSPRRPAGNEPVHARPRSKHASGPAPPHDHGAGWATAFSLSSPLSRRANGDQRLPSGAADSSPKADRSAGRFEHEDAPTEVAPPLVGQVLTLGVAQERLRDGCCSM
jgi:hypothetical protein